MSEPGERVVVFLLTYGEPEEPSFREQYDYSLLILRRLTLKVAPIPRLLLPYVAFRRARGRVKLWKAEDYRSPLEPITGAQVEGLKRALSAHDPERRWEVCSIYEFRRPLLPQILHTLSKSPPDRVLFVPMYLANSDFTNAISRGALDEYARKYREPFLPAPEYVESFSEDERLVELMERHILDCIEERGWREEDRKDAALVLGVHGTLVAPPQGIDTGLGTTQCFYQRLRDRLADRFAHVSVGWLNHTLGGEWTSPGLETVTRDLIQRGIKRAVYYPFGFLADNAESQLEGRLVFHAHPELDVMHLPCLNTWGPFIDYLAERVMERLRA